MSRWDSNKRDNFAYVGRLGDTVDFNALPTSAQSTQMAEELGAVPVSTSGGAEACGSPGEVANVPSLGHLYPMHVTEYTNGRNELDFASHKFNYRSKVWTNVVLRAEDQLRQRMAWALIHILVIGAGVNNKGVTEVSCCGARMCAFVLMLSPLVCGGTRFTWRTTISSCATPLGAIVMYYERWPTLR